MTKTTKFRKTGSWYLRALKIAPNLWIVYIKLHTNFENYQINGKIVAIILPIYHAFQTFPSFKKITLLLLFLWYIPNFHLLFLNLLYNNTLAMPSLKLSCKFNESDKSKRQMLLIYKRHFSFVWSHWKLFRSNKELSNNPNIL